MKKRLSRRCWHSSRAARRQLNPFQLQLLCQHIEKKMPKELRPGVAHISDAERSRRSRRNECGAATILQGCNGSASAKPEKTCTRAVGERAFDHGREPPHAAGRPDPGRVQDRLKRRSATWSTSDSCGESRGSKACFVSSATTPWPNPSFKSAAGAWPKHTASRLSSLVAILALSGTGIWFVISVRAEKNELKIERAGFTASTSAERPSVPAPRSCSRSSTRLILPVRSSAGRPRTRSRAGTRTRSGARACSLISCASSSLASCEPLVAR